MTSSEVKTRAVEAVDRFAQQWPQLFLAIVVIALLAFTLWDASVSDDKNAKANREQAAEENREWRNLFRQLADQTRTREKEVADLVKQIAENGNRLSALLTQMLDTSERLEKRLRNLELAYDRLAPRQYPRGVDAPHHSGQ